MESAVPSLSSLSLGLCKLCSLEQLMFLSRGCIWDQGKIQLKNYAFSVTLIGKIFCVHNLLPTEPFLDYFRSSRNRFYYVLSCGYFAVLQN